ncbi:MAG: nitrate reductase subunit beta [Bacteroidales bacterium]|nr:nitrate reductase subunit beta [Bacteroidales bacterium]
MNIKSQISIVFHLDKCIGCHTCSIACKNAWTDRKGAEYMWWNNVETKPGTGYPHRWEEQDLYRGGWEKSGSKAKLRGAGKVKGLGVIFQNPNLPSLDNYYEPWTYRYEKLLDAPEGDDQPTAEPISLITGDRITPKAGPNWDDDLGGSPLYARNDSNLEGLSDEEKESLFQLERMVMFYLPRICNHCLNPACVAGCPSGAIYKRGEDGIVLINQKKCRAWRLCVTACPYKKVYFNWNTGKSEKCILCYPRVETMQIPACMHSCVGRIRYLGVMLYDADRIEKAASSEDRDLVGNQLDLFLDPRDPEVISQAKKAGIPDSTMEAARNSPVWKYVKEWGLALPLHPEFRTLPSLFYALPLLPAMASMENNFYSSTSSSLWNNVDDSRLPMKYLANLFSAGDTELIRNILKKMLAVRIHRRSVTVGDITKKEASRVLQDSGLSAETADAVFRLTSLAGYRDRFVIPPAHREEAIEAIENTFIRKENTGFGFTEKPERGL